MNLVILDVDPLGADALALLHDAWQDARALYPELFGATGQGATNEPLGERGAYVVAYVSDYPVACGALRLLNSATAEVRRMYVHRDHRRRGLARAVLRHLEREAVRLKYGRLVLETGYKQFPAMRLYEACGFRPIGPFGEHANDATSCCFERLLSNTA